MGTVAQAKRVLVVDDEPEVTFALKAFFLTKGYEMLTALDGLSAMRSLQERQPIDLVLLDMKMPGVNGVEVLKFIHAQSPSTQVIVVTAYDVQFQEMAERLGVDGFLIKPFGIEALTALIEEVLAGKRPAASETQASLSEAEGLMPKARLLFVEPSDYTYKLKEVFFSDPDQCGGSYEVASSTSLDEAIEQLKRFHPDILLVDLSMLGSSGELILRAMAHDARPQELILHGSGSSFPSAHSATMEDLSRQGVKVVYNESFTRAGLLRLASVIRRIAIAKRLVGA